jgi:hypothetical protein
MACSASQEKLIERLLSLGAAPPPRGEGEPRDFSILKSFEDADDYIRRWRHLLPSAPATKLRAEALARQVET